MIKVASIINDAKCYFEKLFDRVPREVTGWALNKMGDDEWLVK